MFIPFKSIICRRFSAFVKSVLREELDSPFARQSREISALRLDLAALKAEFDSLRASHDSLRAAHKKLCEDFNVLHAKHDDDANRLRDAASKVHSLVRSLRAVDFGIKSAVQAKLRGVYENFDYLFQRNGGKQPARKVVYTCMTGGYDRLPPPESVDPTWDYVCFTDSPDLLRLKTNGAWTIRPLAFSGLDDTRNSRWHKLHPHVLFPACEESLWIDANVTIRSGWIFGEIRNRHADILIPLHFQRDCVFDELKVVGVLHLDEADVLRKHLEFLEKSEMPRHYGLNESCLIYRRHSVSTVVRIMEDWWSLVRDFSKRDQLSLSFVLWKHGVKPDGIALPNLRTRYRDFQFTEHTVPFSPRVPLPEDYRWEKSSFPFDVNERELGLDCSRIVGWAFLPGHDCETFIVMNNDIFFSNHPIATMRDSGTDDTQSFRPTAFKARTVSRPDVQKAHGLTTDMVGFAVEADTYLGTFRICLVDNAEKTIHYADFGCPPA